MHTVVDVLVNDQNHTVDAQTANLGQFAFPEKASGLIEVTVIAVRESDQATKSWQLYACVKRLLGGAPTIMATSAVNMLANAADTTAMSGASIAMFSDGTYIGVACTGFAGATIDWTIKITGKESILP